MDSGIENRGRVFVKSSIANMVYHGAAADWARELSVDENCAAAKLRSIDESVFTTFAQLHKQLQETTLHYPQISFE